MKTLITAVTTAIAVAAILIPAQSAQGVTSLLLDRASTYDSTGRLVGYTAIDRYVLHFYYEGSVRYVVDSFGFRMVKKDGGSWEPLVSTTSAPARMLKTLASLAK
jgi:hypothetical protein